MAALVCRSSWAWGSCAPAWSLPTSICWQPGPDTVQALESWAVRS